MSMYSTALIQRHTRMTLFFDSTGLLKWSTFVNDSRENR